MEKISVSIRVRPLDKQETAKGTAWKINKNTIMMSSAAGAPPQSQVYVFDNVFGIDSTTLDIYIATTKDIVASAVKGFNGTVFAYGQTSSGKTFTMRGTMEEPGIIPRAVHDVFKNLEEAVDREFLLRMSYMEIYNEEINDLLAPEQTKLQVHESLERGIFVAGLREEIVASPEQVLQLMEFGEAHRHIGETNMNVHSSRSHTIFRMVIESREKSQDDSLGFSCDAVRVSVLNLVDLAGSERVAKTGAEGARLKEGTHINKSLMVLGNVINKLSEGIQNQGCHVPYRDSKLTRILQPALGGNARTAIICNITPAMIHMDESRGTLQFASRAIRVTNCAQVNEILTDAALLKRQKREIEELRSKLKESHSEHLEEEILTLRNTLLKSECERERIALELEEEKRAHAEREREQAQKIENLSTLVLNSTVDDRDFEKRSKKNARRETWCPRITTGNILDDSLKEERWNTQNKARMFPMPPPFESLLEEDESSTRELGEVQAELPLRQENAAGICKDDDAGYGAVPVPGMSARIHVADRKRKYHFEVPAIDEMSNDVQFFALDSELGSNKRMEVLSSIPESNESIQRQRPNTPTLKCAEYERDDGAEQTKLTMETVEQLSRELSQAKEEVLVYKEQLESAAKKIEQLKNKGQFNVDKNSERLLNDLKREKEELALELSEAHLQFEAEKATWEANQKHSLQESPNESSIVKVHQEDAEYIHELESLKSKADALGKALLAAQTLAEQESNERVVRTLEVNALQEKVMQLETELLQEKALRDTESKKLDDLHKRLFSLEGLLVQNEADFAKEKWRLKTEALKLQFGIDALSAKTEVYRGRLLEAQDELKEVYEKLEYQKSLNGRQTCKEEAISAETSHKESLMASVLVAAPDNSVKQSSMTVDVSAIYPNSYGQCKPVEGAARTSSMSGHGAHTVSIPINVSSRRQDSKSTNVDAQRRSRPLVSALRNNAAAGNKRNTTSTTAIHHMSLKPPKGASLVYQKNMPLKGLPAMTFNKENSVS